MDNHIVIIGAGPAGLSLACSLTGLDIRVTLIEKSPESTISNPEIDGRDIAITHRSKDILEKLQVWSHLPQDDISEIKEAKVLNGSSPYALHFGEPRKKSKHEPMGFIISNHLIRKALYEEVKNLSHVTILCDAHATSIEPRKNHTVLKLSNERELTASLVIAADSRFSNTRRNMGISTSMHDFGRTVIVCRMSHEQPHEHIAYECFQYGETLAVLPLASRYESSIVITLPSNKVNDVLSLDEQIFNQKVSHQFEHRYGKMTLTGKQYPYPLVGVYANTFIGPRFALIGDAAVGMHPVTAHGFNLGLQGQDYLAKQIKLALKRKMDIGSATVLSSYNTHHRKVSMPIYLGTNAIVKLFTNDSPISKVVRKATLRIANNIPLIKNRIMGRLKEKDLPPIG